MNFISNLMQSKKFWGMLIGLGIVILSSYFAIDSTTLISETSIIATYLGAQGLADLGKEKAKVETPADFQPDSLDEK